MQEYRGDIQIYRALAVSLVLLFHLGIQGFNSGFLGVDIFFVISGYLMQTLHRKDHGFASFYTRRARRLLPAYFATVFATIIAAAFVTLPMDFAQTAQQTLFSVPFASNIGFWMQNSYFSKAQFNPLLHLWSLGVEIQFYLFFPIIAWLCRDRRWLLIAILLGSLALCFALVTISPKTAFFMMPARLWQFSLGMLAAGWTLKSPVAPKVGLVALAGMAIIPLIPLDADASNILSGHPGFAALAVSFCTALALACRLPGGLVDGTAGRAAQRLGDISYSLYLAHWPALVLFHYQPFAGTITSGSGVADLLLSLLLIAVATAALYILFERPGPRLYSVKRSLTCGTVLAAAALFLPSLQLVRFPADQQRIFSGAGDRAVYRCGKLFRIQSPGASTCPIGEGSGSVLLVGDSHADSIKRSFAAAASRADQASYFSVSNEPLLDSKLSEAWLASEARRRGATTVYLHYSSGNLDPEIIIAARKALSAENIETVLIAPVPVYRQSVLEILYRHAALGTPLPGQDLAAYARKNGAALAAIRGAGIPVIEVAPTFCAPGCRLTDPASRPAYFDDGHLTLSGARMLEPVFDRAMAYAAKRAH